MLPTIIEKTQPITGATSTTSSKPGLIPYIPAGADGYLHTSGEFKSIANNGEINYFSPQLDYDNQIVIEKFAADFPDPPATTKQTDFVLCGDGEWKDISKIAAHAAGPSNKTITITLTGTSTTYTAPETGWISYRAVSATANSWISLTIETTTLYAVDRPISDNSNIALNLPISKGQKATINCASNVTFTSREAHFIYTNGSVPA